jgi:hypothetical protein
MTLTPKDTEWIISGRKTAHADPLRLGYAGDILNVRDHQYEIVLVQKISLVDAVKKILLQGRI